MVVQSVGTVPWANEAVEAIRVPAYFFQLGILAISKRAARFICPRRGCGGVFVWNLNKLPTQRRDQRYKPMDRCPDALNGWAIAIQLQSRCLLGGIKKTIFFGNFFCIDSIYNYAISHVNEWFVT